MALELKPETLEKIEALIPRYPQKRSAALPLCHLVQEDQGWISQEAIEWIAEKLDLQPINIYEIVTFYPMLRDKPVGKRIIRVCRTLPCALAGSYKTCASFQEAYGGLDLDEPSEDGEVMIEFAECLASCGTGPVVMINDNFYEQVGEDKARELVKQIKTGAIN
ncbi:MAG: NAD(P)H-dependent oxidoreductase subunit E [Verrucomicrobiota bacterium]